VGNAKEIVQGSEKEQYSKLWDYCHELLKWNSGSTVKMDTLPQPTGPPTFHKMYICLKGCLDGFKEGCRPMIGLGFVWSWFLVYTVFCFFFPFLASLSA